MAYKEEFEFEQELQIELEVQDFQARLLARDDWSMYPGWEDAYGTIDEQEEAPTLDSVIDRLQLEEGQNGLFFRSKLPLESFIEIISYLDSSGVVKCSQVCCKWRKTILVSESLWDELKIDLSQDQQLISERTAAVSKRSNGNLRSHVLAAPQLSAGSILENTTNLISETTISQILRTISYSGCRQLKSIHIDISNDCYNQEPLSRSIDAVESILHFCKFAAMGVEEFSLNVGIYGLPAGSPFFISLPNLKRFTILATSAADDDNWHIGNVEPPPRLLGGAFVYPVAVSHLVEICLSDVHLLELTSEFPHFPNLLTLKIYDSVVGTLYDLLNKCCSNLRLLILNNVQSSPILDWRSNLTAIQDVSPILVFSQLETLILSGRTTSLFKLPALGFDHFTVHLPVVKSISIAPQTYIHNSQRSDSSSYIELNMESLPCMLRSSPLLDSIDLSGSYLQNDNFFSAFKNLTSNLRSLTLTAPISDNFIDFLYTLVPTIQFLDVQASEITLVALARFALQFQTAQLPGQLPEIKLKLHTRLRGACTTIVKLTQSLIVLIRRISKNQLEHLLNSLVVVKCPGAKALKKVKRELLDFYLGNAGSAGMRLLEDQTIFNQTKEAMRIWQLAREERWAKDWFHSQNDIELNLH